MTAAGQEVLSWQLTTASGVIYAEQATAGNGPVYQVDVDGAGYLDFNGNKRMVTSSINPGGVDKAQVFIAYNQVSGVGGFVVIMESSTNGEATNGAWAMVQFSDGSGRRVFAGSRGTTLLQPGFLLPSRML